MIDDTERRISRLSARPIGEDHLVADGGGVSDNDGSGRAADVVVVGSVNVDVVAELTRFPRAGETMAATAIRRSVGGKGANQAVAAHRAGAHVAFIGRVGDDADGAWLQDEVAATGVDVRGLSTARESRSGTAFIQIANGENIIVLDGAANHRWDGLDEESLATVRAARTIVCQLEIPDTVIAEVAALVSPTARFVLNAAPARPVAPDVLRRCDPLVVNEHEAAVFADARTVDVDSAVAVGQTLIDRGARSVVVTLGAEGAVWVSGDATGRVPARRVTVVDSTGAGDAFVGVLAASVCQGEVLGRAVERAVESASQAVTVAGSFAARHP